MSALGGRGRLLLFALLVLAQVAFVVGIVVREEGRLDGLEIVLESRPVDPRDPLRGDYVILSYVADDVSTIPAFNASVGDVVYVEFVQAGRYWVPSAVNRNLLPRDQWGDGYAFLLARVESTNPLRVSYPDLGVYFIPQGAGEPPTPPDVILSISNDGVARIKRLEVDGAAWPANPVSQDQDVPPEPRPAGATTEPSRAN
ncbi:MAG: GDYXXLXY domain-containing protein [Chloroflexi bacterium]|nr:GDYXXLXY domain-containing protein [Chloroflexota bacterium]MDA1146977.1 GDYXXLXY domain-containing protein [Chloroflexota bacterium]